MNKLSKKIFSIIALVLLLFTATSSINITSVSASTNQIWQQSRWTAYYYYGTEFQYITFKTNINKDLITKASVEISDDDNVYVIENNPGTYIEQEQCYKAEVPKYRFISRYRFVIEYVTPDGKQHTAYSNYYNF